MDSIKSKTHIGLFQNSEACSTEDFMDHGFISCVGRGLEKKYFNEMFEII